MAEEIIDIRDRIEKMRIQIENEATEQISVDPPLELHQKTGNSRNINIVADYNIPNVSLKIERLILSYIDYVNRIVWQKES